jgi:hypothetical protein
LPAKRLKTSATRRPSPAGPDSTVLGLKTSVSWDICLGLFSNVGQMLGRLIEQNLYNYLTTPFGLFIFGEMFDKISSRRSGLPQTIGAWPSLTFHETSLSNCATKATSPNFRSSSNVERYAFVERRRAGRRCHEARRQANAASQMRPVKMDDLFTIRTMNFEIERVKLMLTSAGHL